MISACVSSHSSSARGEGGRLPSQIRRFGVGKTGAEFFRLLVHVQNQLRTVDPFGKAGKILNHRRGRKLAARLPPFEHERAQVCAGGVNRRRRTGTTTPDNDHLLHARQG